MASPGGFSFSGLGEPLRQLRELIKDLWYRNRQERQRGELQILRDKIQVYSQLYLSVQQIDMVSTRILADAEPLGELIEDGRLSLAGEEPGGRPNARCSHASSSSPEEAGIAGRG